jgi:hypothetical protein
MKKLIILVSLLVSINAYSKPNACLGVNLKIDESHKVALQDKILIDLKKDYEGQKSISILKQFSYKNWSIIFVQNDFTEPMYLFYNLASWSNRYNVIWSGAAMIDEGPEIKQWVLDNNKNIPNKLANCFAWYVTTPQK